MDIKTKYTHSNYDRQLELTLSSSAAKTPPAIRAAEDGALGVGQLFSTAMQSFLPRAITPPINYALAGSSRVLGGLATILTSGYEVYKTFRQDLTRGDNDSSNTRKEVVITSGSVAAGFGAGAVAGLLTASAAALRAPALVVTGIATAGILGVGYAAYKTREYLTGMFG